MRILTLLLLFVASVVCAQTTIYIPEPYGDNFIESELISEVSFVELESESFGMISPDMEMKVDGEDYFVLDNKMTQCVYHFGSDGKLLNTICEDKPKTDDDKLPVLNNPAKFNINPYKKEVEIYNFANSKVIRYNYEGKKTGQTDLFITPSDFVRNAEGNYWVYMGWNNKQSQYRLLKIDANGMTLDRKMRLVSRCTPIEGFAFYVGSDKIYMWEALGNLIYSIDNNSTKPEYRFDYGARNLPLNFHNLNGEDSYKSIQESGYYTVKKYVGNKDFGYIFLNYISSSQNQLEMFHVIHDKKSGQVYVYTENSAIGAFDKAQYITDNNELVFLVAPRKVRSLLNSGSEFVPAPFENLPEDIARLRNPIILKIKLESFRPEVEQEESNEDQYFGN